MNTDEHGFQLRVQRELKLMPFGNPRPKNVDRTGEETSDAAIPKGLCPPAQGCEERATLGQTPLDSNPNGVVSGLGRRAATPLGLFAFGHVSQGSSFLATLGFAPESLWDLSLNFRKSGERFFAAATVAQRCFRNR